MGLLVNVWNAYIDLPVMRDDDIHEFRHAIHILQNKIMARPTRRNMKIELLSVHH